MISSLQGRLLIAILVVISLIWGFWFMCQVMQTSQQQQAAWDEAARDTAVQVLLSLPRDLEHASQSHGYRVHESLAPQLHLQRMGFQIWQKAEGRLLFGSPLLGHTPLKPDFRDGHTATRVGDGEWRVFALSDTDNRIQVQIGKPQMELERANEYWRGVAVAGGVVTFALLAVAMWIVIHRSLRPVHKLQTLIESRDALDLEPLPNIDLPCEIQPLVDSFNQLLVQFRAALEGERRFIADAAHELRTPLAALTAHAELALSARDGSSQREALLKLMAVVKRSARLSEQLLDSARIDTRPDVNGAQLVGLHELVLVVTRDFEVTASKKRQTLSLLIEPCTIAGYVDELGILIRNVVDNALRYAGEGGRVEVTCKSQPDAADGTKTVVFTAADDGPGVPVEERERIFDRFYRVAGSTSRGSGIGLSLVSRIAQLHDASIRVGEGINGRGFSISITFAARA